MAVQAYTASQSLFGLAEKNFVTATENLASSISKGVRWKKAKMGSRNGEPSRSPDYDPRRCFLARAFSPALQACDN